MKKRVKIVLSSSSKRGRARACWNVLTDMSGVESIELENADTILIVNSPTVPTAPTPDSLANPGEPANGVTITLNFEGSSPVDTELLLKYMNPGVFASERGHMVRDDSDLILQDPIDKGKVHALLFTATDRYFKELHRQTLFKNLRTYLAERDGNQSNYYYGALSWLFGGVTREAKISAVKALIAAVTQGSTLSDENFDRHRAALSQGRLGALYQASLVLPKQRAAVAEEAAGAEEEAAGAAAGSGLASASL